MKTVVVIGGGITGLSTVFYLEKILREQNKRANIVLVEADSRLGGKILTRYDGEFIMETGADSLVRRKMASIASLLEELGIQNEVVYNETGTSYIYTDGQLKPIPEDTIFGIPLSIEGLANSELVSAEGKVEALKDFYTQNETFTKQDSIGQFLMHFLGKELVEKQIEPVLSGVYSGNLSDLTIASTLPYLLDYKNEYGSILKGLMENRSKYKSPDDRKFLSFKKGVSILISGIESCLTDVEICKGVKAETLDMDGNRYRITLSNTVELEADYVVLSTLSSAARNLLASEDLNLEFDQLKNSSLISVYLGFDVPDEQLPKDGTGFITSGANDLICDACTWTSRKWKHTSRHKRLLVRLFYKSSSPHFQTLLALPEEELMKLSLDDLEKSLGLSLRDKLITSDVTKWDDSMPNYHIKHHEIVKSLENKLAASHPGVILAGCSYYGVGIVDCIVDGERTARTVAQNLI
ncbi:protoporphyrinogen oxidase [Paenibacillus sp. CC-CFT747]|nr:protoporphyrinogen oxidase [Paenibacillus sp. CC-CFT747]